MNDLNKAQRLSVAAKIVSSLGGRLCAPELEKEDEEYPVGYQKTIGGVKMEKSSDGKWHPLEIKEKKFKNYNSKYKGKRKFNSRYKPK